ESLRPRNAPVDWPPDEGDTNPVEPSGDDAWSRRAHRVDAMDEVKRPALKVRVKSPPDQLLEVVVGQSGEGGGPGPAEACHLSHRLAEASHWFLDGAWVNGR